MLRGSHPQLKGSLVLTKKDAITEDAFHYTGDGPCSVKTGPRGGQITHCVRVRRNGATQTRKTRPSEWRAPVKYGIKARDQFSIRQSDAPFYHAVKDCPAGLM